MKDPKDCMHENFRTDVRVVRLEDSGRFVAEIAIRCTDCDGPFRFIGLQAGMRFDGPTVSIDELELHAPIEPEGEKRLQASASYQMPAIPTRH